MSSPRFAGLAALLSICVACQSAFAASGTSGPARLPAADFLPPAERPLELRVDDVQTNNLNHLVGLLAEATGVEFTIDESTRNQLRQMSTGLAVDVTVPPEEAWRWVEGLLVHSGFQLGAVSLRPPYLVGVYPMMPRGGIPAFRPRAIRVAVDDLVLCEAHPAFNFITVLDLPHVDVRQLGNSLRALTSDPSGGQNVVPVGNSNSIILTGQGSTLSDLAAMLLWIEEREREAWEGRRTDSEGSESGSNGPTTSGPGQTPPGRG